MNNSQQSNKLNQITLDQQQQIKKQQQPIQLENNKQLQQQNPDKKYPTVNQVKQNTVNIKIVQKIVEPWIVQDILQNSNLLPTKDWNEQFAQDLHRSLLKEEQQDTKRMGQVLGLTVIGLVGFALTLSVIGLVAGSIIGIVLGGYAGKRIKRKKQRGKNLIHFDLFMVNCACYYAVLLDEFQRNKENIKLNNFRFKIQRCFKEYRGVEIYSKLSKSRQKGFKQEMMRLVKLLQAQEAIKAMYLIYKITKVKLRQTQNKNKQISEQQKYDIQYMICIVLRPAILIFRICNSELTQQQKVILLKYEKLSLSYEALQLLSQDLPQELEMNQQEFLENLEKIVTVTDIKEHFQDFDIEAILKENQDIKNQSPQKNSKNKNLIDVIQESIDYVEQRSATKPPIKRSKDQDGIKEENDSSSCSSLESDEIPNNDLKENKLLDHKNLNLNVESKDISMQKNFNKMKSNGEQLLNEQTHNQDDSINLNIKQNINQNINLIQKDQQKDRSKSIASQVKSREYNVHINSPTKLQSKKGQTQTLIEQNQDQTFNKSNTISQINQIPNDLQIKQQQNLQQQQQQQQIQHQQQQTNTQKQHDKSQFQQNTKQQENLSQNLNQNQKQTEQPINNSQNQQQNKEKSIALGQSQKLTFHQMNQLAGLRDDFLELDECASNYQPNLDDEDDTSKNKNTEFKSFQRNMRGSEFLKCNTVKIDYIPKKFEKAFPQNNNSNNQSDDEDGNEDDHQDFQQNIVVGDTNDQPQQQQQNQEQNQLQNQEQNQNQQQNQEQIDIEKEQQEQELIMSKKQSRKVSNISQKSNKSSNTKNKNSRHASLISVVKDDQCEPSSFKIQAESKFSKIEDTEINDKLQELLKMYEETIEAGNWNKVIDKPEMKIYKKQNLESAAVMVRATSLIQNATPQVVYEQIYDAEQRSKWDKVVLGFQQLEKIDEQSDVIYSYVDAGFGVTKRDWVQKRVFKFDYPNQGQITICYFSSTHPQHPPKKNHIRADSYIAGYVMTPVGNDTELFMLSCNDIKGLIPKYIVNYAAARAPKDWINSLQSAVDKKLNNPKSKKK